MKIRLNFGLFAKFLIFLGMILSELPTKKGIGQERKKCGKCLLIRAIFTKKNTAGFTASGTRLLSLKKIWLKASARIIKKNRKRLKKKIGFYGFPDTPKK